jgi:hypothetical protein
MAIKVQGTTVIDDSRQLNVTGISTLGTVKISSGIVTATSGIVTYYGDGSNLINLPSTAGGGKWIDSGVGIVTTSSVGINTTTVTGTATSEGALQVAGNVAILDGALIIDQNIDVNLFVPSGKNGLFIGPTTVGLGVTIDVAPGSTLVVV